MSKDILVLEEKTVTVGGKEFLIVAFDTVYGLKVMGQLGTHQGESMSNPDFIKGMITKGVRHGNGTEMTGVWFDKYFSKKYDQLFELVAEVIAFNFGELGEDPNAESDTSES